MPTWKSPQGSQTRRWRFTLQLLAAISVAVGGRASSGESARAYDAPHRPELENQVVHDSAGDGPLRTILQTQAVLPQAQEALPGSRPRIPLAPVRLQDDSTPSSSDVPGEHSAPKLPVPASDRVDDVGDAGGQDLLPAPLEESIRGITIDQRAAPRIATVAARPSLGAVAGSYSSAPNMIGDFFGDTFLVLGRSAALAGGDRRFKIAENVSPAPQDRIFFNYNHFENALRDINDVTKSLDRFTFGFEKTFLNSTASVEMRLPFASGLDSRQSFGVTDTQSTELGDLALAFKAKLMSGRKWIVSAGTTMTVPTGDDLEFFDGNSPGLRIENDAVHMAPFIGYLVQPNRRWFAQAFLQADFDLGGNEVSTSLDGYQGILQDQNLLFIDASLGRWLGRSCDRYSGVAAIAELHYTSTLNDTDEVARVTNPFNRMDILNASGALNFQFGPTSLRVGGAAPLRQDEERLFDAEIIVQLNRNF